MVVEHSKIPSLFICSWCISLPISACAVHFSNPNYSTAHLSLLEYGPLLHSIKISFPSWACHPSYDCHSQLYISCCINAPAPDSFTQINNKNFNSTGLEDLIIQFTRFVLPTTWNIILSHFRIHLIVPTIHTSPFYIIQDSLKHPVEVKMWYTPLFRQVHYWKKPWESASPRLPVSLGKHWDSE